MVARIIAFTTGTIRGTTVSRVLVLSLATRAYTYTNAHTHRSGTVKSTTSLKAKRQTRSSNSNHKR